MPSRTVLVVEDTELLRRMYADKLQQDGYSVLSAADGLEALSYLKTHSVDLMLLDLVMPRMSGLEVLDTVKRDPRTRDIPVVVLSNLGQDSDVQQGLEMGAADYLIKNEARPADVSAKIGAVFAGAVGVSAGASPTVDTRVSPDQAGFHLLVRDREGDADAFVQNAKLSRRFWCPACEVELQLVLVPQTTRAGWYDSHLECPACKRGY